MDIEFQLKDYVTEYCEDTANGFKENTINKIVDYLINEYGLNQMDESELENFMKQGHIEDLIDLYK